MNSLWNGDIVCRESAAFVEGRGTRPVFPVAEILAVRNATLGVEYEAGRDYRFCAETGMLERPADSRIPVLSHDDLYPQEARAIFYPAPNANALPGGPGGGLIRFDGADFFARMQFELDYRTNAPLPELCSTPFKNLNGKHLNLVFIGDSITVGLNATGTIPVPPYAPPYPDRTAETLRAAGAEVVMRNFAVGGSGCAHGREHLAGWLDEITPDILVIAYGMNDLRSYTPTEFAARIAELAELARQRNPAMKILMVAPMPGNAEWEFTPPATTRAFSAALRELPYLCADVTTWWEKFFARKNFFELTGNGVNHPNDYGQRLYAAVVEDELRKMW